MTPVQRDDQLVRRHLGALDGALAQLRQILTLLALLDRLCAMLTRLAHMGDCPSGSAQFGQRERSR
jgi:hypothetical protein